MGNTRGETREEDLRKPKPQKKKEREEKRKKKKLARLERQQSRQDYLGHKRANDLCKQYKITPRKLVFRERFELPPNINRAPFYW